MAEITACPACAKQNPVPAAATGKPTCGACGAPLPWIVGATDLFTAFDPAAFPSSTIRILGTATLAYQHGADTGEAFNLVIRDALFEQ